MLFSLMCILMAAFPGRTIQADPLFNTNHSINVVSKKHPVPFMGSVNAVISDMTGAIPFFHVTVDGSGNVTHLGKVALHLEEDIVFDISGAGISDQYITYTAANGDQLAVHAISTVIPRIDDPSVMDVESTFGEFTGGSGRFEEASGSYHLKAIVDRETGRVQAWVNGMLQY